MALNRQGQAGFLCQYRGVASHCNADLAGADVAACGLHAHDFFTGPEVVQHFAVLDDVHAHLIGRAGIAPGHRVVAGGAGVGLQHAAINREARLV